MKIQLSVPDERIKKVKSTWDEKEANELLTQGWILMSAGIAHKDDAGFQAKTIFILANK
uniref:Uncharacterized protein n=1 Tax=viral metagenome TaxID=1070528 RepID=A0A6M3LM55_9ZZZZ